MARYGWLLAAVLAFAVAAVPAEAKHPPRPTSLNQPPRDGCQRSTLAIGFDTTPEWVYVYRNPAIRMARGLVRVVHPALDESILQHQWYDFNANLVPDAGSRYLVAGSRHARTENFGGERDTNAAEEIGRLHFEWESGTLPFFAWPTDGDRATIWGSWIWDCGHWTNVENNQGGTISGERTELHPLNAIVVNRRAPYLPARSESESDAFISNDGNLAHSVEQCALHHHPASATVYDSGFTPCARNTANKVQPLARSYSFFVPAPPKPSSASSLKWRIVKRIPHSAGTERVRVARNGLDVTVRMPRGRRPARYGKSFFVSWTGGSRRPATLKVTIKSVLVKHADPNPALADPTPPPWNLYLDVNGYWKLLNDWAPALYGVHDGQLIRINRTFTIHVPAGARVWVQTSGRECDEPSDTTLYGVTAGLLHPCPANRDEINPNIFLLLANDGLGTIVDTYRSAGAALGNHVRTANARTRFPGTGTITLGHGSEGDNGYVLSYSIRRG
jgi:hypothetical protein